MAEAIVNLFGDPGQRARFCAAGLAAAYRFSRDRQASLMLDTLIRAAATQ